MGKLRTSASFYRRGIPNSYSTFGLIAPYYIEYAVNRVETVSEQYDPEIHQSRYNILGTGNLFEGLGQSELAFGANVKAAVSFEFGVFKSNVTGLIGRAHV